MKYNANSILDLGLNGRIIYRSSGKKRKFYFKYACKR